MTTPAPKRVRKRPAVTAAHKRSVGQGIAASAAAFLPVASYVIAHSNGNPWLWLLVVSGLAFSAPTLAEWAYRWCHSRAKAWGFTILLEGVMILGENEWLALTGLALLCIINCYSAWYKSGSLK